MLGEGLPWHIVIPVALAGVIWGINQAKLQANRNSINEEEHK